MTLIWTQTHYFLQLTFKEGWISYSFSSPNFSYHLLHFVYLFETESLHIALELTGQTRPASNTQNLPKVVRLKVSVTMPTLLA